MTDAPASPWPEPGPRAPRRGGAFVRWFGRRFLRLTGWSLEGQWPDEPKLIVAVAPHTTNYDFVLTVAVNFALNLRSSFLAKHTLFRFPFGTPLRRFGGIAVDRASTRGLVGDLVALFQHREQLILGITPEGTRSAVRRWKTGFAQVAYGAEVPILPVTLNYDRRVIRLEDPVWADADPKVTVRRVQALASAAWPGSVDTSEDRIDG
ncbi:MAG: 1-acyl-sn-glycerol-3-phosphate acyltransferase [Pseudomonadota bacterium]